jgi:AbrB family looped-hinge helix DNA binding protein
VAESLDEKILPMPPAPIVVRVSSRYQIVIPPEVREAAKITPGTEFEVRVGSASSG